MRIYRSDFPVPVIQLEGDLETVARAHGELAARQPNGKATLRFLSTLVEEHLAATPQVRKIPFLGTALRWLYSLLIQAPLINRVPDEYRAAYRAFAEGLGVPEKEVLGALTLPDGALRVISLMYKHELRPDIPIQLGCSSIIWDSGPGTTLHGRNLDYEGVGIWDQNQVLMHVIPDEGLAYVAATALGVPAPLTAFNETGLTMGIHQLSMNNSRSWAVPMPIIAAEIIRKARSIDDAIRIIRGYRRAGGWAYVFSQGRDRAVVETTAADVHVRRSSEGFFFQTNHVSSPAIRKNEIFYSPGAFLDSLERAQSLAAVKQDATRTENPATADQLLRILRSQRVNERSRPAGGTLAKLESIQAVVMDASNRRLWLYAPDESQYHEYSWTDLRTSQPPKLRRSAIVLQTDELRALMRQVIDARASDSKRLRTLEEYTQRVRQRLARGEPVTGAWPGLFLNVWQGLRAGPDTPDAANELLSTVELILNDRDLTSYAGYTGAFRTAAEHRLSVARLFRGRLLDLSARRDEALKAYQDTIALAPYGRVKKAAREGLKSRYSWLEARGLSFDWSGIDLFRY